jgi:F0F1-type ATP synthase membrane subunit c/vacuolar-type H+-ATPase subunit K
MIPLSPLDDSGDIPLGSAGGRAYRGLMTTTELSATSAVEPTTASVPATTTTTNGLSIASLVLGVAGIVAGFWFASVAAIVVGFMARNREPQSRSMANWGLVLGFVGAFWWLAVGIIGLAVFAPFAAFLPFWL